MANRQNTEQGGETLAQHMVSRLPTPSDSPTTRSTAVDASRSEDADL